MKDAAWEKYMAVKVEFQRDFYNISVSMHPELKEIWALSRDTQLALIESQSQHFYFLKKYHPERILRNMGLGRFTNFGWNDEDESALLASNPEYVKTRKLIDRLNGASQGHPMWGKAREAYSTMSSDKMSKKIIVKFNKGIAEVKKILAVSR